MQRGEDHRWMALAFRCPLDDLEGDGRLGDGHCHPLVQR